MYEIVHIRIIVFFFQFTDDKSVQEKHIRYTNLEIVLHYAMYTHSSATQQVDNAHTTYDNVQLLHAMKCPDPEATSKHRCGSERNRQRKETKGWYCRPHTNSQLPHRQEIRV